VHYNDILAMEPKVEYEACIRDGGEMTISNDEVNIEYGKISFVEGGKEYDLNKVMKRRAPNKIFFDYSQQNIPKGVIINGIILRYPNDFTESDEIDWNETVAYRKAREIMQTLYGAPYH
jgi:hypothetical protein